MRILLVNSWYYPNMKGGAEQSVKLLAENLVNNGHAVAVMSADAHNKDIETENINGVSIYRIKSYLEDNPTNFIEKVSRKLNDIQYKGHSEEISRVFNEFQPEVIHTNSISGFSTYVWKISHEYNIPIVHTLRDYGMLSPRGVLETIESKKIPYNLFLRYYNKRIRELTKYVSYVTAPSEYTLKAHLKEKYFVNASSKRIVNAVKLDLTSTEEYIEERKKRKQDSKKIIFAGRLLEIKGIKLLLESFSLLPDPKLKLIICGEGKLADLVKEASKKDKRIIYKGQISQDELSRQYKEADIAVFPSLWDEPFGRVIIEANQYGLPVVASNRGGIPEVINTIGGGELFINETASCLSATIKAVLYNDMEKYYSSIIRNISYYDIKKQVNEFQMVYFELVQKVQ